MMILRRFLVLQSLMLWQGGFLFYATFVVPIGTEILGSAQEQGKITRLVTEQLNLVGGVALVFLLWDLLATRQVRFQFRLRLGLWFLMLMSLLAMIWLHFQLESIIDAAIESPLDRRVFRPLHRLYLWLTTLQWAAAVIFSISMIRIWTRPRGSEATCSSSSL